MHGILQSLSFKGGSKVSPFKGYLRHGARPSPKSFFVVALRWRYPSWLTFENLSLTHSRSLSPSLPARAHTHTHTHTLSLSLSPPPLSLSRSLSPSLSVGVVGTLCREVPGNAAWFGGYEMGIYLQTPKTGTKADIHPIGLAGAGALGV
jgi:hypothetical protein